MFWQVFSRTEIFACREMNQQSFSNPHPRWTGHLYMHHDGQDAMELYFME